MHLRNRSERRRLGPAIFDGNASHCQCGVALCMSDAYAIARRCRLSP